MTTNTQSRAEIVRNFIDQIWNGGQSAHIGLYIASNFVDHAYEPHDASGHAKMVEALKLVVPDAQWTVNAMVETGDTVMVELSLTGTHRGAFAGMPASGNDIQIRGYRTFVFDGEGIVEHRALLDTHAFLEQMKQKAAA